jgi:hypothetical protein
METGLIIDDSTVCFVKNETRFGNVGVTAWRTPHALSGRTEHCVCRGSEREFSPFRVSEPFKSFQSGCAYNSMAA